MTSDPACFSTPIRNGTNSVPGTPNKRNRNPVDYFDDVTPSKAPRLMQPVAKSHLEALQVQTLISRAGRGEDDSSSTDSELSVFSDTGSVSPVSDISSLPSSSPDVGYLDTFYGKSVLTKEAIELNRIIAATMSHEPCHRLKTPQRSILSLPSKGLNLVVSSSRGSLEDATIYATEINAIVTSSGEDKIPMLSNTYERVTIPVNPSIKRKYKQLEEARLGGDYEADETESEIPDAALIEGYEFEGVKRSGTGKILKKIRWADERTA